MAGPQPSTDDSAPHSRRHSQPTSNYDGLHDILPILYVYSRKRKLLYLIFVAFAISILLFTRELLTSEGGIYESTSASPSASTSQAVRTGQLDNFHPVPDQPKDRTLEPVVFSFIMWSEDSAAEGALLLKSIFLYNTRPSDIHIICDDKAEQFIRTRVSLIQRPSHRIRIWFYKPSWQSMLDRVEREGSISTDHSAGLPGLMKLFIHEVLPPTVTKSIFIDTDALFIADPALLWDVFATLRPATAIVMASHPDQNSPEWNHASRICSCIMLLDLEKLRSLRMMDSRIYHQIDNLPALSPDAFKAKYGLPGGDGQGRYDNVRLGDQGYWWAIVDYRPDIFEPLSYDFEVTSCLLDMYLTGLGNELTSEKEELGRQIYTKDTPQEGHVVLPKLLHFNCLHGTPIYMQWSGWSDPSNSLTARWGAAVSYHVGFKWIWLNKGRPTNLDPTVEMSTISHVIFADELALKGA